MRRQVAHLTPWDIANDSCQRAVIRFLNTYHLRYNSNPMSSLSYQTSRSSENHGEESPIDIVSHLLNQLPRTCRVDEPRKHWEMLLHCERAMYPRPMPNLTLPSREARFYWHLYSASANHEPLYQRNMNLALLATLNKLVRGNETSRNIIISEQLVRASTYDPLGRRDLVDRLEKYLRGQRTLETFCMEGLRLKRREGVRLVSAVGNSRRSLKSIYCWRGFGENQRPVIPLNRRGCSIMCCESFTREGAWWRAITSLKALTTISVNYAYIATPSGDLLLQLAENLGTNWQWLQLLCQETETPIADYTTSGENLNFAIPDIAWKATRVLAPMLKVQLVFIDIPEYDRHKLFFTKHTPVHTFMLSSGIDLRFRQPWYIDCTIRNIWSSYTDTLVSLYLQLWHHRENLDHLLCKLFTNLPELRMFEFIGEIRTLRTLCAMCCQIQTRSCKVNHVSIQLQETVNEPQDRGVWKRSIECLLCCFKQDFDEMGVHFNVSYYPC